MIRMTRLAVFRLLMLVAVGLIGAAPALTRGQGATPAAEPVSSGMQELFGLVPAQVPELDDPANALIFYADLAAQLDAVGVTPPESVDAEGFDRWVAATRIMALPSPARDYLLEWREDYGFDLLQADQTLWISLPPFDLMLFRGRFDEAAVRQSLEAVGYRPVEVGGHELLSLRDDFEYEFGGTTAYAMAAMNFGTILDDGTLAFASAGAPLAAVLDVAAGTAPSMLDLAGVSMLLGQVPPDLASAVVVQGVALTASVPTSVLELDPGATPDVSAIATEMAETSEMPPVAMALLGATTGSPRGQDAEALPAGIPDARAVAVLLMLSPESAETAVATVEERLATGISAVSNQPYNALFSDWTVRAVPGTPVVRIDLTLGEAFPNILMMMLFSRDLGFLAW